MSLELQMPLIRDQKGNYQLTLLIQISVPIRVTVFLKFSSKVGVFFMVYAAGPVILIKNKK